MTDAAPAGRRRSRGRCSAPARSPALERAGRVGPVPVLPGYGLGVPQRDDREGAGAALLVEFAEPLDDVEVVRIAEALAHLGDRHPPQFFDLVVRDERRVGDRVRRRFGGPVVHLLVAAVGQRVLDDAERGAERDHEAGLFGDLAHRGLGQRLARVEFALGQRHVAVLGAVHDEDLRRPLRVTRQHTAPAARTGELTASTRGVAPRSFSWSDPAGRGGGRRCHPDRVAPRHRRSRATTTTCRRSSRGRRSRRARRGVRPA